MSSVDAPLLCGHCGYDLRSASSHTCPECGQSFDPAHLTAALIPWEQRRQIGRIRAFARTVRDTTFYPSRITGKAAYPISLRHAHSFRRHVCFILTALTLAFCGWNFWQNFSHSASMTYWNASIQSPTDLWPLLIGSPISAAAIVLGASLAFFLITDLPRPFFAPFGQRAEAIGHYACAPFVWIAIPAVASPFIITFVNYYYGALTFLNDILLSRAIIAIAAVGIAWNLSAASLLRLTTRCSIASCVTMTIVLITAAPLILFTCIFLALATANLIAAMWLTAQ